MPDVGDASQSRQRARSRSRTRGRKVSDERIQDSLNRAAIPARNDENWELVLSVVRKHRSRAANMSVNGVPLLAATLGLAPFVACNEAVQVLCKHGVNADIKVYGKTALHIAVLTRCEKETFDCLISAGANPSGWDDLRLTPLHEAAALPNIIAVRALLRHGANPLAYTLQSPYGTGYPIHMAGEAAPLDPDGGRVVRALLSAAPPGHVNAFVTGPIEKNVFCLRRPIHWACAGGRVFVVHALLCGGADVELCCRVPDEHVRHTPLSLAVLMKDVAVVRLLLNAGAAIDRHHPEDCTPLMIAAQSDSPDIPKLLLRRGANMHLMNSNGLTAGMLALSDGNIERLESLGLRSARVEIPHMWSRRSAFQNTGVCDLLDFIDSQRRLREIEWRTPPPSSGPPQSPLGRGSVNLPGRQNANDEDRSKLVLPDVEQGWKWNKSPQRPGTVSQKKRSSSPGESARKEGKQEF